jgi:hypothetical protein
MLCRILMILFTVSTFTCSAKIDTTYNYYDSSWNIIERANAFYIQKSYYDGYYWRNDTYRTNPAHLQSILRFKDSSFTILNGELSRYYENGVLKEKSLYKDGALVSIVGYYENAKIKASAAYDDGKPLFENGFTESGDSIPGYIVFRAPQFAGGLPAWKKFLERNLNAHTPADNGAPAGRYKVSIIFTVNPDGSLSDIKAENNPGYGTMEEALRMFKKSPNWTPAILYNSPARYRQRQPITFVLSGN